jgi:SOS-response transcriptional repressor LexA
MDKKIFSSRLKQFAATVSATKAEFANLLEMSPQMLHKYINGERLPLPEILNKIRKTGCNINWLLNGEGEMLIQKQEGNKKTKKVPVLGEVECGVPIYTQLNSDSLKYTELADVNHYVNPFFVIARGDSMRPYINPGDHLLCIEDFTKIKDGRAVVVNFRTIPETYMSNAKLIRFLNDDRIMLYSINTKFPPTIHRKSDIYKIYKVVKIIREVR